MDENLRQITDAFLRSYATGGGINTGDGAELPSRRAIADICEDLLQLFFPGFHDRSPIRREDLPQMTTERVMRLSERMAEEIWKSLRQQAPNCPKELATAQAHHFMGGLPRVRELLATDVEAAVTGDPAAGSWDEVLLSYPFIEAIAIQRAAHVLNALKTPLIPRMMTEWAHSRTGIDIHPGATIGSRFFIDHGREW